MALPLPSGADTVAAALAARSFLPAEQYARLSAAILSPPVLTSLVDEGGVLTAVVQDGDGPHELEFWRGLPHLHCLCADNRRSQVRCKHVCWALMRFAGVRDWSILDPDRGFSDEWGGAASRAAANVLVEAGPPPREDAHVADPGAECPICYEPFGEDAPCVKCTACPSMFHRCCAREWGRSCPMCRDPHQFRDLRVADSRCYSYWSDTSDELPPLVEDMEDPGG